MEFKNVIGNESIFIDDNRVQMGSLIRDYDNYGNSLRGKIEEIYSQAILDHNDFIGDKGQIGSKIIVEITTERELDFLRMTIEEFMNVYDQKSSYFLNLNAFLIKYALKKQGSHALNNSKVMGGGFGVKGAVKGMVMSSIANSALEGAGNALTESENQTRMDQFNKALRDGSLSREYADVVISGIKDIAKTSLYIQHRNGIVDLRLEPSEEDIKQANSILENLINDNLDNHEEAVKEVFSLNPFDPRLYLYCEKIGQPYNVEQIKYSLMPESINKMQIEVVDPEIRKERKKKAQDHINSVRNNYEKTLDKLLKENDLLGVLKHKVDTKITQINQTKEEHEENYGQELDKEGLFSEILELLREDSQFDDSQGRDYISSTVNLLEDQTKEKIKSRKKKRNIFLVVTIITLLTGLLPITLITGIVTFHHNKKLKQEKEKINELTTISS